MHPTLPPTGQLIQGQWLSGDGPELLSHSPSDGGLVWRGLSAASAQVDAAYAAARLAQPAWWARSLEERIAIARRYASIVKERSAELAELISRESGKTLWESRGEVGTVAGKIELSIEALHARRDTQRFELGNYQAVTRFHPFGVMAVLGPFNFPAHLPNGHIVPALLAGNTVVFKPSELTPAVGAWMAAAWQAAGLPAGVLNLLQGAREVGQAVAAHPQLDGLLFTGSSAGGRALHRAFAEHPQKILALEMGGNNPLVVYKAGDLDAAAYLILVSAFITAGQRCTCARRLILVEDAHTEQLLARLKRMLERLRIGYWTESPEPFYGTVISPEAGQRIEREATELIARGAVPLMSLAPLRGNSALLSPGLVEVTGIEGLSDEEVFGPLLTVRRVSSLEAAIAEANRTRYGLSAGLISDQVEAWQQFIHEIRAGVVNWNRQTTGASGKLPFGGCGLSGNHRPAGFYSADYCSWAIGSLESQDLQLPGQLEPGIEIA
ncbi:MAG: succinylglutamate-semialdehyde dehydrogenase [Planctomycetota bacterium]|nr:succinylglutamate-semialdehyde dehydrogenase [Blastopirellula sp.]